MKTEKITLELKQDEIGEIHGHAKDGEKVGDTAHRLLNEYLNQLKFSNADETSLISIDLRLSKIERMLFNLASRIPLSNL
jgi:hypothetical protein